MKRIDRPIRIASRQITTHPMPSASEGMPMAWVPGIPMSCAATSTDKLQMSLARSTVYGPAEEVRDLE